MPRFLEEEKTLRKGGLPQGQVREMLEHMQSLDIPTAYDVQDAYDGEFLGLRDRCSFGQYGLCCRNCEMGPCRLVTDDVPQHLQLITPAINRSTCGKTVDDMVANMLLQTVNRGASAHLGHALHIVETFADAADGHSPLPVRDEARLERLANVLGVKDAGKERILAVARVLRADLQGPGDGRPMASFRLLAPRHVERAEKLGLVPLTGATQTVVQAVHATAHGMTNSAFHMLALCLKLGIIDLVSLAVATELQDILLGAPKPTVGRIGFDSLDRKKVNVVVHGHFPPLAELVVEAARRATEAARAAGAEGVNVVGLCCTGNEMLMRQGLALVGNNLQQELAIGTGLVDAIVVDVQCIFPALSSLVNRFHTRLITTMEEARMEEAIHIPMGHGDGAACADRIVATAIEAYSKRAADKVFLPKTPGRSMMAGFSVELLIDVLSKLNAADPLKPLLDAITGGTIKGAVLLAGCTSLKVQPDMSHVRIARGLLKQNVLVIATGCAAGACARAGLLDPASIDEAGPKLRGLLEALGQAAGLNGPLPPVLHFGACVDNSRVLAILKALADRLDVPIEKLPVAASAAELVTEKAMAIGVGALGMGVTTHVGVTPKVLGSPFVVNALTQELPQLTGSRLILAIDPDAAIAEIGKSLDEKRRALGLEVVN